MAETNGHQDNVSRLDRIEAAMELMAADSIRFREDLAEMKIGHKLLAQNQAAQQELQDGLRVTVTGLVGAVKELRIDMKTLTDQVNSLRDSVARVTEHVDHLSAKIDFVVDGIDRDHREFHARLTRLEEKQ